MEGKVVKIKDTQEFDSGFKKREFWIETDDEKYPQTVAFETHKDMTTKLDKLRKGSNVEVTFDVRGNVGQGNYSDRCFVNLVAWKLDWAGGGQQSPPDDEDADDIPF